MTSPKTDAVMLRPRQIEELYGIPQSTLSEYCTRKNDPLPSSKIPGRNGRRGKRLIRVSDLEAWLSKYSTKEAS